MLTSVWRISYEAHVQLAIDWILGFDLLGLGMMEDEIFKKRHQDEVTAGLVLITCGLLLVVLISWSFSGVKKS
jgi:hypothetical protein